jgi:tetratricopeptide (TPR) repeat protein
MWNSRNQIFVDNRCSLVQGDPGLSRPPFIVDEILKRNWTSKATTSRLVLTENEIARLITTLGCVPISLAAALGHKILWRARIDERVDPVSRTSEVAALESQLQRNKVVAVVGEPKTGKSTLCQLLASALHDRGMPIWTYDYRLAGYSGRFGTAQMFEKILSDAKTHSQQTIQDDIGAILGILASQPRLLIIDNFETALDNNTKIIADAAMSEFVEMIMNSASTLQTYVVFTSITPFATSNYVRPSLFPIPGINHGFAIEYLMRPPLNWSAEQAESIYAIRPGNFHAMLLASCLIKDFLENGVSFDKALDECIPEVLSLTYGISYSKFSDAERLAAQVLALHPDGLDSDALKHILRSLDFHGNALRTLMQLYGRSAISKTHDNWFSMLPQDRQYVYEQINDPERLHKAALEYFQSHYSDDNIAEGASLQPGNEYIFFHAIRAKQIRIAFEIFTRLKEYTNISEAPDSPISMGLALSESSSFGELTAEDRGQVLLGLGRAYRHLGEVNASIDALRRSRLMFAEANNPVWQAWALSDFGLTKRKQGEYQQELECYEEALSVLGNEESAEAIRVRSSILGRKGQILQRRGESTEIVLDCLNMALALARQVDDPHLIITRLAMLGSAHREMGQRNFPSAMQCFSEAVRLSEATDGNPDLAGVIAGLAKTHEKARQLQLALPLYLKAYELTNRTDQYGMLDRLGTLGHVYKSLGQFPESERFYNKASELARTVQNRKAEAENLDELGALYRTEAFNKKNTAEQEELLYKALQCHEAAVTIQDGLTGDPSGAANRLQELGRTFMALHKLLPARRCFVRAVHHARDAKKAHLEAWQFYRLAQVLQKLGEPVNAYLCYRHAINLSPQEMNHVRKSARAVFDALPPISRDEATRKLRSLDTEIEAILNVEMEA